MSECKKHRDWDSDEWMAAVIDNPKCPACQQELIDNLQAELATANKRIEEMEAALEDIKGLNKKRICHSGTRNGNLVIQCHLIAEKALTPKEQEAKRE